MPRQSAAAAVVEAIVVARRVWSGDLYLECDVDDGIARLIISFRSSPVIQPIGLGMSFDLRGLIGSP